jgi:hypothetical protein
MAVNVADGDIADQRCWKDRQPALDGDRVGA